MSTKAIAKCISIAAVLLLCFTMVEAKMPNAQATSGGNGLVVPIYGWDSGYEKLIEAKKAHPDTSIIAVLNPDNGPGGGKDSHWSYIVSHLKNAGVKVVGYISTSYTGVSQSDVESQIDDYYNWYGTSGVFLDEVSPDNHDYYKSLADYAKSSSTSHLVVLNPGAPVPASYSDAADVIIIFENAYAPSSVDTNGMAYSKLGVLTYGVSSADGVFDSIAGQVKYMYAASDWSTVADDVSYQAGR